MNERKKPKESPNSAPYAEKKYPPKQARKSTKRLRTNADFARAK
jgi:hypothetical protein